MVDWYWYPSFKFPRPRRTARNCFGSPTGHGLGAWAVPVSQLGAFDANLCYFARDFTSALLLAANAPSGRMLGFIYIYENIKSKLPMPTLRILYQGMSALSSTFCRLRLRGSSHQTGMIDFVLCDA